MSNRPYTVTGMRPLSGSQRDVSTDDHRRLSFGTVVEQCDSHRPGYPAEIVEDVIEYAKARPGGRVLDVGVGTGRTSLLCLARRRRAT